jgi:CheY-like chemotaxis protein
MMKLLLADDDADQLELRSLSLSRAGYEIYLATDEKSALQLAAEQRPDVAVVDLRIPTEEAGLRLIRALKKLDGGIRLIVLSGSDPKRFEALPERALVEAVMTKGGASRKLIEYLRDSAGASSAGIT